MKLLTASVLFTCFAAATMIISVLGVVFPRSLHAQRTTCLVVNATVGAEYVNVVFRPRDHLNDPEYNGYVFYQLDTPYETELTCWFDKREPRRVVLSETYLYPGAMICVISNVAFWFASMIFTLVATCYDLPRY